jgi:hypothetical protein
MQAAGDETTFGAHRNGNVSARVPRVTSEIWLSRSFYFCDDESMLENCATVIQSYFRIHAIDHIDTFVRYRSFESSNLKSSPLVAAKSRTPCVSMSARHARASNCRPACHHRRCAASACAQDVGELSCMTN